MKIALARLGILVGGTLAALAISSHRSCPPPPMPDLVRYEDGSGVLYIGDREVGTYPEGTFTWHCESMGDRICGNTDDADLG